MINIFHHDIIKLYRIKCRGCQKITITASNNIYIPIDHNIGCEEDDINEVNLIFDPIYTGLWPIEVSRIE